MDLPLRAELALAFNAEVFLVDERESMFPMKGIWLRRGDGLLEFLITS